MVCNRSLLALPGVVPLLALLSSIVTRSSAAAAAAASITAAHVSSKVLSRVWQNNQNSPPISATLGGTGANNDDSQVVGLVDVSRSNLLDEGLIEVLQTTLSALLVGATPSSLPSSRHRPLLDFNARMNGLTATGVTDFLTVLQQNNANSKSIPILVQKLDFGWNRLFSERDESKRALCNKALGEFVARGSSNNNMTATHTDSASLQSLHLACTGMGPSTCRSLAKGLLTRFEKSTTPTRPTVLDENTTNTTANPLSLYLSNNADIGDAGVAALAAAIRRLVQHDCNPDVDETDMAGTDANGGLYLDTLDLSHCNIGDIGANALALALEDAVVPPIRRLILAHNRISNQGALSLGRSLLQQRQQMISTSRSKDSPRMATIDLSGNPKITDRGIAPLLDAVEQGALQELVLRSCSIYADGAELVGKTLRVLCSTSTNTSTNTSSASANDTLIDLSGNPLGVLRGKSSADGSSGGGYSASLIKSKATATASAYVTQGLSFLTKSLGNGFNAGMGASSTESDDEEDKKVGLGGDESSDNKRCGFKALANAFIGRGRDAEKVTPVTSTSIGAGQRRVASTSAPAATTTIRLGLRRTFCDSAGADALAAMMLAVNEVGVAAGEDPLKQAVRLDFSLELNPVVEDEMMAALKGDVPDVLLEMAERHNDAMEILNQAQERAARVANRRRQEAREQQRFQSDAPYNDNGDENDDDLEGWDEGDRGWDDDEEDNDEMDQ